MDGQYVAEIVVTRKAANDAEVVDKDGSEIVAIVSPDGITTLDGYEVKITEAPNVVDGEDLAMIDENEAAKHILKEMTESGIPLDIEVVKLMIDSWHDYLQEIGLINDDEYDED